MRKIISSALLFGCLVVVPLAQAEDRELTAVEGVTVTDKQVVKKAPVDKKKEEARRKAVEKKRSELEATEWNVALKPRDSKSKPENDTFIFQNGEFKSENRAKRGFNSTNYTVSIPEGDLDSAVFETMQMGKEGYIFIKGQWVKASMQGEIMEQLDGGKLIRQYYFTNAKMTRIKSDNEADQKLSEKKPVKNRGSAQVLVSTENDKVGADQTPPDTTKDPE